MKNLSLTISDLKEQDLILFECIAGSRAYGLATATSDTDIKGVFYLPQAHYFGLQADYISQVSNETNDEVYYELGRFFELLLKNNPSAMELLATPTDKILYKHALMNKLDPAWVISKLCKHTFAGFANSQIKKARGLNKKIVNPIAKEKQNILDFCTVFVEGKSLALNQWLQQSSSNGVQITQRQLGLAKMPHSPHMYAVYIDEHNQHAYAGVMKNPTTNHVLLSSIPKGMKPLTYLSFNQEGYSKYCNDYSEYWSWVEKRNEARYQSTMSHGKQYDAKNMMHTIRLLQVALDIALMGTITVHRDNRDELLAIKTGEFEYDALIDYADELNMKITEAFETCSLREQPDSKRIVNTLISIRSELFINKS